MDDQAAPSPRLVKKVAVGFSLNAMPPQIIRAFTILRGKLQRAGFQIEVGFRMWQDLPPDLDVLFVPDDVADAARQAWPSLDVRSLSLAASHQPAFDEFLAQLQAGETLTGQRAPADDDQAAAPKRATVRYRGNQRLF